MLSEERIKKMIRLSEYETGLGSTDLIRVKYRKMDYVRFQVLKTFVAVLAAFGLAVGMAALYYVDYIMQNALLLPMKSLLIKGGIILFVILLVALPVTWRVAMRDYEDSHNRAAEYYTTLQELIALYKEEEQGQEESEQV